MTETATEAPHRHRTAPRVYDSQKDTHAVSQEVDRRWRPEWILRLISNGAYRRLKVA
jgi:hypothetical protein